MFFYLPILAVALFISIVFTLLLDTWRTCKKFSHVPWVGMKSQHWWMLNYARVKNFINIKKDFTSIADQVATESQTLYLITS